MRKSLARWRSLFVQLRIYFILRHRRRATALATLLEPLLVVAMGGVVILIARDDAAQYLGQLGLRLEAD